MAIDTNSTLDNNQQHPIRVATLLYYKLKIVLTGRFKVSLFVRKIWPIAIFIYFYGGLRETHYIFIYFYGGIREMHSYSRFSYFQFVKSVGCWILASLWFITEFRI